MSVIVADAVAGLADQAVTRRRFAAGAYSTATGTKGTFVQGATTDTTIAAVIRPVSDRTRQNLPEGIRLSARYTMHTLADVRGDEPGTTTQADRIVYNSRTYVVITDERNEGHGQYRRVFLAEATAEP